jgi:hypothetical protein
MTNDSSPSRWSLLEIDLTDEKRTAWTRRRDSSLSVAQRIDCEHTRREQGAWVPACNGMETPFRRRTGHRGLYCWQPSTRRHAYLDCRTDALIPDAQLTTYGLGS